MISTLKALFYQVIKAIDLRFDMKNLKYLPRWVILSIDIFMVIISGFFGYIMLNGIGLDIIVPAHFWKVTLAYLLVKVFFFWMFKTYSGIIRFSSYLDAVKIFLAETATFVIFFAFNTILVLTGIGKLFLNTRLFITGVLSFCFLLLYRIVVKQIYEVYFDNFKNDNVTSVFIFGTDSNALAVCSALNSEKPKRFKVVGFIDKDEKHNSKQMLGLPIIPYDRNVAVYLRAYKASSLIVADKNVPKEMLSNLIDQCIDFGFKVYSVPLVSSLSNEKAIPKHIKSFNILDLLGRKPIKLDLDVISKRLSSKTVLVTGAAGSIGSEIVRQVLQFNPDKIVILDQAETPLHSLLLELQKIAVDTQLIPVIADVRDEKRMAFVFESYHPEIIYHAAAYKHVPMMELNPCQAILTNVFGTKVVADLAKKHKAKRFVLVSTDKAVNPSNVMGASKRIAEIYVQNLFKTSKEESKTKYITTRFGNVLGSNGSVVPLFTKQIQEGGPITITHPDIIRYFMTIPEACQLVLEAGSMGKGGEIFVFDMGKPVKIIDLAKKMIRLAGLEPELDIEIKIVGLRPGEKLFEELLNDSATTLPTHHEKIMIGVENSQLSQPQIDQLLVQLFDYCKVVDTDNLVRVMKNIVPEFKSQNSIFQSLDN